MTLVLRIEQQQVSILLAMKKITSRCSIAIEKERKKRKDIVFPFFLACMSIGLFLSNKNTKSVKHNAQTAKVQALCGANHSPHGPLERVIL